MEGIEPSSSPWKGDVGPLNYTRWSESRDSNPGPRAPKARALANCATLRVPRAGVEPARWGYHHEILSLARLPVPPPRLDLDYYSKFALYRKEMLQSCL